MHKIIELDKVLFKMVNTGLANTFFDWLLPWLRNSTVWMPLYFFLLLFFIINYKQKAVWYFMYMIGTVVFTDFFSSKIIKNLFMRERPCVNEDLVGSIRILVGSIPHNFSFTSSHAANHFGIAMFLYVTFKKQLANWSFIPFIWAFSISFAQVYVGVHYPLDIIGGALVGIFIGYLCGKQYNKTHSLI